jgi:AraC family transcriptional regulator of adaptative response/methylated-DNA-[protein]-cysteine methyltransferase
MSDYHKMAKVIHYLVNNSRNQPSLDQLSRLANLSPYHFQRKFKSWVGVSHKAFLQHLTYMDAKTCLLNGDEITRAALNSGLSGPGRLYDLCINLKAASPGEIKKLGEGLEIKYGIGLSPFGRCLIGIAPRGICYLAFIHQFSEHKALTGLTSAWPQARLVSKPDLVMETLEKIFSIKHPGSEGLNAFVTGTDFQLEVWQALLKIPLGKVVSYGYIADFIGMPRAARGVGSAVAKNQLAYLIPCHRVIRNNGVAGEYRWGNELKEKIIAVESAIRST